MFVFLRCTNYNSLICPIYIEKSVTKIDFCTQNIFFFLLSFVKLHYKYKKPSYFSYMIDIFILIQL